MLGCTLFDLFETQFLAYKSGENIDFLTGCIKLNDKCLLHSVQAHVKVTHIIISLYSFDNSIIFMNA